MSDDRSLAFKLSWLMLTTLGPDGQPWTTRTLAEATKLIGRGMSHATVGKLADGTNDNPRMQTLADLAAALNTSPGFFFPLYDVTDLPAVRTFGNVRIRTILTLMEHLSEADLAEVEALARKLANEAGDPPQEDPPPPEAARNRPGRRRMSEAARRAAKTLEP
ncbi:helix-turn-helix domain-containing protein [Streptomyces sp. NPDC007971]|uniref:helix-turn-helix domain-containing protein n=1 Tax=Streptomyces sp. NPDC007971 TaxID=3364799 RepID=UPI0036EE7F55